MKEVTMRIIASVYEATDLPLFAKNGATGIVLGVAGFCAGMGVTFDLATCHRMASIAKSLALAVYLRFDKMIREGELEALRQVLSNIDFTIVDAIICFDQTVLAVAMELGIAGKIIYQPGTQNTNLFDPWHYQTLGVKGITISREVTLSDIVAICACETGIELSLIGHGHLPMFYSARHLISDYVQHKNKPLIRQKDATLRLEEDTRPGTYFPLWEDESGTQVYRPKQLCSLRELGVLKPYLADLFLERSFVSDAEYLQTIRAYADGSLVDAYLQTYGDHCDSGSFYERTDQPLGEVDE